MRSQSVDADMFYTQIRMQLVLKYAIILNDYNNHTLRTSLDVKLFIPNETKRISNKENGGLELKHFYPNYQHENLVFIKMFYT